MKKTKTVLLIIFSPGTLFSQGRTVSDYTSDDVNAILYACWPGTKAGNAIDDWCFMG